MALQTQRGAMPQGEQIPIPVAGIAAYTTAPLAANAVWQSGVVRYNGNDAVLFAMSSNVAGSYNVEYYSGSDKLNFMGATTQFDPAVVSAFQGALAGKGDGFQLVYTNGPVAQNTFFCEIRFAEDVQETLRAVAVPASPTNLAGTTHAFIEGRQDGAGNYLQATATQTGAKVGTDVYVVNPSTPTDTSALAKSTTQTDGTQKTQVTNFPATQAISGSVGINGTVPVSGSFFQATQPVSIASVPLPTGASTSALQTSGNSSLSNIDTDLGALADTAVIDPSLSASVIAALKGILSTARPATQTVVTNITTLATTTTVLAANPNRKGYSCMSINGAILVKDGAAASATSYSGRLITNAYYAPSRDYSGPVTAIGAGTLVVTEYLY